MLLTRRRPRFSDLRGPRFELLPIVWTGVILSVFQQFVGINVIFYYSSVLWQSVGITQSDSLLISFSSSIINIVGTFIAMALVDKGRPPPAAAGRVGSALAIALAVASWSFSYSFSVDEGSMQLPPVQGAAALIAASAVRAVLRVVVGVIVWVLLGEMFPGRIRAAALSVRGGGAVAGQLGDHRDVPAAGGLEPGAHLPLLRRVRRRCRTCSWCSS